jgi:hypothetical protein
MYKADRLASPALTVFLALVTPIFFILCKNWHMFDLFGLLFAALFVLIIGAFASLPILLLHSKIQKNIKKIPKLLFVIICLIFSLVVVETCCFFLQTSLFVAIPEPRWKRIVLTRLVPFIVFVALLYKYGLKPVNVFLLIFLCTSIVPTAIEMSRDVRIPSLPPSNTTSDVDGTNPSISNLNTYKIGITPNIYLFFLESYHSLDIQREIYNIDTALIEQYITKQQFMNYGKIYSNTSYTLGSYTDTFYFYALNEFERGVSDTATAVRLLICGDDNNTLFKILKSSGYTTILLADSYFGTRKGKNLDISDFLPREYTLAYYIYNSVVPLSYLNTRFHSLALKAQAWALQSEEEIFFSGSLFDRVKQAAEFYKITGKPIFTTFIGGACHPPFDGIYSWEKAQEWIDSKVYQNAIDKANSEIIQICDYLIANDPGSIIILIGDHGARRLQAGTISSDTKDKLYTNLRKRGTMIEDFCDDLYGVFLAIRMPEGDSADISHGMVMSHVNLFRHIFAYINKDDSILETRAPSRSYLNKVILVEDGIVLHPSHPPQ